jgi:hydantoinase/carbamoylase family amidase
VSGGPAVDARRVIADLRELATRTGDERGAQRLCWTETWQRARAFLTELLNELGLEAEVDDAGNLWARLDGAGDPPLALGSHIDSVPDGGWLDGALGVMTALGVLRAWVEAGQAPPRSIVLVDWADEEGARFGHSLFGSSAFAGALEPSVADLRDADENRIVDVLAEHGVDLDRALGMAGSRRELAGYLEFHIEQGPVLEEGGVSVAAVDGCAGIERHRITFTGQAAHAGTTPMDRRADAGLAAAETSLRVEAVAKEHAGMGTTGALRLRPGIPTAVAGQAELLVDLRHAQQAELTRMLAEVQEAAGELATARNCSASSELVWRIEPTHFDERLVAMAEEAAGTGRRITSGALHDAAMAARVTPAAMMFVPSIAGLSHAKQEDTAEADLTAGIEAFGALANGALAKGSA